ncbi:MAG: 2TM domain-containing protein [Acidimicrobiia bacterium]|nr:2TM domain-containing protein [Acidimicrobiia bacterium]
MRRRTRRSTESFTYDEVGDVIKSATRLQQLADEQQGTGEVTMEQLREIAVELKISPEALRQAIATSDRDLKSVRRRVRRKLWWVRHAGTYAAIMIGVTGIDLAEGNGIDWAYYPILGWGIWVGIHAAHAFSGGGSALERRLMNREMRRG